MMGKNVKLKLKMVPGTINVTVQFQLDGRWPVQLGMDMSDMEKLAQQLVQDVWFDANLAIRAEGIDGEELAEPIPLTLELMDLTVDSSELYPSQAEDQVVEVGASQNGPDKE